MDEKFVRYADIVSVTYNYNAHDILFRRGCKKLYCTIDIPSWFEWDIEFHLCGFHGSRYYERMYGGKIKGYKDNGWIYGTNYSLMLMDVNIGMQRYCWI
jgi:hypothetical protein